MSDINASDALNRIGKLVDWEIEETDDLKVESYVYKDLDDESNQIRHTIVESESGRASIFSEE